MSCGKLGWLYLRSRSQQRSKMSVNVCPDNIFRITEHFVTKFWMVMQHHEPECHAGNFILFLLCSRSRSQRGLILSKYDSFYYIFWTVDSLANKFGLMIHHQKPECPLRRIGLLQSGSRSQWKVKMLMFAKMIFSKPPNILLPNLVFWCIIMSGSVMQKDWFAVFKVKVTARAHIIHAYHHSSTISVPENHKDQ